MLRQYASIDIIGYQRQTSPSVAAKSSQLQIRVSDAQKRAIQRAAARAGLDMSSYVLSRVLSEPARQFQGAVRQCAHGPERFALAELNALLAGFAAGELREAIDAAPEAPVTAFLANYVAAMVECACARHDLPLPEWTRRIAPLAEPVFGSTLLSLRLHLLTHSPPPFRRRNLFVDATVGDQV